MTNLAGTEQVLETRCGYESKQSPFLSTVEIYGENRGDVGKIY